MNDHALGQLIATVFLPSVPAIAGIVIALTLLLIAYVALRDGFLKEVNAP